MSAPAPERRLSLSGPASGGPAASALANVLDVQMASGFPPAIALAVVDADGVRLQAAGGEACVVGEHVGASAGTLFDLASLTKVVCTVTLVLLAREEGRLELADPVQRFLPGFPRAETTLAHLLTHTSGLVGHRPFYATLRGRQPIEQAIYAEAEVATPASEILYSDLNFMLLGWVLERCFDESLDALFARRVAGPLALADTRFRPPGALRPHTAATELDGDQRNEPGLIWGEVHDGNAWALGGVAGHAGLFSSVGDLARFASALLRPGALLAADSLALVTTPLAASGDEVRAVGWRLAPRDWGAWPAGTFWHTGFTGTSLLVAPALERGVVVLTNAVHPVRRLEEQGLLRERIHRCLAEAMP